MAVVDLLSAEITNLDADPTVLNDAINWHGRLRIKSGIVEMASGGPTHTAFANTVQGSRLGQR